MDLGRSGIWSFELRTADTGRIRDAAAELDEAGWGALWIPGGGGGPILADAERLLQATRTAKVAIGVASIWQHRAAEIGAGHAALQEQYGRRLMLGLGVSDTAAARQAGRPFRPLSEMSDYLDELDQPPSLVRTDERLMAALGPKMVELAGRRTAGIHPFAVTPDYTAATRTALGPGPLIAPYQAVILDSNDSTARSTARAFLGTFISMGHYDRSLRRQGFTEEDLGHGGSDRLVNTLVAWGGLDAIAQRIRAHHDAGADHVCLHVLSSERGLPTPDWRRLASLNQ
jgi:probable F420-dependent oxidoreductase